MRLVLLIQLVCAGSAWACSCFSAGNACTVLRKTDIVFLGRLIEESGAEGFGSTAGKVAVEEVLHGLPPETRELYVNTGAGTSCYWRLQKGERYVIFASRGTAVFGAGGIFSGPCDSSFPLLGHETLFAALRNAERGGAARLVGHVQVRHAGPDSAVEPEDGLMVEAKGAGRRFTTLTNGQGEYEFLDLPPGSYRLKMISPRYFVDEKADGNRERVAAKPGCDIQDLAVWPDGQISGTARTVAGEPIAGIPVQAFIKDRLGEFDGSALREHKTDRQGRYLLRGLPPGDVMIAVNGDRYKDPLAWPPTFYRNGGDRETAETVRPERGRALTGVDLTLTGLRQPVRLLVEVVMEDGTPAFGAGVGVENLAGHQRAFVQGNDKAHRLGATVYAGETYVVKGWRHKEEGSWEGEAGPFTVTGLEKRVRVALHEKKR